MHPGHSNTSRSWAVYSEYEVKIHHEGLSVPGGQEAPVCNCPMVLCLNLVRGRIIFHIRTQQYLHIPMPASSLWNSTAQARAWGWMPLSSSAQMKQSSDLYRWQTTCLLRSPILKQCKDLIPSWDTQQCKNTHSPLRAAGRLQLLFQFISPQMFHIFESQVHDSSLSYWQREPSLT